MGKLPEVQDGISQDEKAALEIIIKLYNDNSERFDATFEQMYQVGIPEVRKYCTPLQALYWMIEDGKTEDAKYFIANYKLERLLEKAWRNELYLALTDDQVIEVINGIKDKHFKQQYLQYTKKGVDDFTRKALLALMKCYKTHPKIFSEEAYNIIDNILNPPRWKNFETVVDRLNAPELIDFYGKKFIEYDYYLGSKKSNKEVFISKAANCSDHSEFNTFVLNRSGYRANIVYVFLDEVGHVITRYRDNGKIYIMDSTRLGLLGPFNSMDEIPYKINSFKD